jgi:hypothetical protein
MIEIKVGHTYRNRSGNARKILDIKTLDFVGDHQLYVKFVITRYVGIFGGGQYGVGSTGTILLTEFAKWAYKEAGDESPAPGGDDGDQTEAGSGASLVAEP